ncbi:hypothetical protein PMAYCL1PPCAC_15531, partial [Pristionchus mayeri]
MPYYIDRLNFGIGIITNSLLLFLIETRSCKAMGSYKKLLGIFATYDVFLIFVQAIIDVRIFNLETTFSMFSNRFPEIKWICPFYCAAFVVPFVFATFDIFLIQFLANYFSNCRFLLELCFDSDVSGELQEQYREQFNVTVALGWSVMKYW